MNTSYLHMNPSICTKLHVTTGQKNDWFSVLGWHRNLWNMQTDIWERTAHWTKGIFTAHLHVDSSLCHTSINLTQSRKDNDCVRTRDTHTTIFISLKYYDSKICTVRQDTRPLIEKKDVNKREKSQICASEGRRGGHKAHLLSHIYLRIWLQSHKMCHVMVYRLFSI